MKKTRIRILEDMLISREKIKTESNSLKLDCTAEDLSASITCIEANKLEQETSSKGKNVIPTAKSFWESGHYETNGNKANYATRMRVIDLIECEPNTEYFVGKKVYIIRGINKEKTLAKNIGVINGINNQTFTTDEDIHYLAISADINYDEYDEETDQLMICKMSEVDKTWEKGYVDMPSTKYKSPIEGVTGNVKLKVQNKNFAQNVKYLNPSEQYRPCLTGSYQLKKGKYYVFSCDTENSGEKIYINMNPSYGLKNIIGWGDKYHLTCDGKRKSWVTQALDSNMHKNMNIINKSDVNSGNTNGINTGYTNNFMIEEIPAQTKEEALEYVSSKFVEHKEQNFTISLGNNTLYKGDKIIRRSGKWYFSHIWKKINDFSDADFIGTAMADKKRLYLNLTNNYKKTDTSQNMNGGWSNILKLIGNGRTYQNEDGFTTNENVSGDGIGLYIYIEDFAKLTLNKYKEKLSELGAYFILPIEEELELIEDEVLIKQLDKILLNIYEYDDETNFDFDKEVTFEIEVEKDNIRLLNSRLDEIEKQSITTSALALESEV